MKELIMYSPTHVGGSMWQVEKGETIVSADGEEFSGPMMFRVTRFDDLDVVSAQGDGDRHIEFHENVFPEEEEK